MDDTQIEMLPMLGEFSSIASQYEHIMFYYESGIQQIVAKLQILNNEFKNNQESQAFCCPHQAPFPYPLPHPVFSHHRHAC